MFLKVSLYLFQTFFRRLYQDFQSVAGNEIDMESDLDESEFDSESDTDVSEPENNSDVLLSHLEGDDSDIENSIY